MGINEDVEDAFRLWNGTPNLFLGGGGGGVVVF